MNERQETDAVASGRKGGSRNETKGLLSDSGSRLSKFSRLRFIVVLRRSAFALLAEAEEAADGGEEALLLLRDGLGGGGGGEAGAALGDGVAEGLDEVGVGVEESFSATWPISSTSVSSAATTLAVRGSPVRGPSRRRSRPRRASATVRGRPLSLMRTSTLPRLTTNIESPASPARMIDSPGA